MPHSIKAGRERMNKTLISGYNPPVLGGYL